MKIAKGKVLTASELKKVQDALTELEAFRGIYQPGFLMLNAADKARARLQSPTLNRLIALGEGW